MQTCCYEKRTLSKDIKRDDEIKELKEEMKDLREQIEHLKRKIHRREAVTKKIIDKNRKDLANTLVHLESMRLNYSMEKRRADMLENQNSHLKDRLRLQKQTNEILTMKQERSGEKDEIDEQELENAPFPTTTEDKEEEEENMDIVEKSPHIQRRTTHRVNEMIDAYPDDLKEILTGAVSEMSEMSDVESN